MRIIDWSSDVCSTDLLTPGLRRGSIRLERGDTGDGAAEDEGVNVVGALVGVDRLEVHDMAHDLIFRRDAVAAVHVARLSRDIERLADLVALAARDTLGRERAFVPYSHAA